MKERVVLITGASGGIGKALALKFAKEKDSIVIHYHKNEEEAFKLKKKIEKEYNRNCLVVKADVRNEDEVKKMVQKVIDTFGRIDILINNAGIDKSSFLSSKNKKDFCHILDVNLIGPFLVSKEVSPYMLERKKGVIINISSNNGINASCPYSLEYDASKAALNSLTYNLSDAYAPYINVNAIAPGWVETDMIADMDEEMEEEFRKVEQEKINKRRFAKPSEIAALAFFLSSDEASYINREIIKIDGGFHG